ncbi:pirin family protein [Clostridium intestinale]|uniref:Pirin domain-containing protein n=1 Tax=Clostridium intestinale URNW TaxID=1294142 RepID=U2NQT3_9CLOT|nr:pirin family protein [Clostridium intestinale]ERK31226.1 pirin domain-containing protein [Clostridium intestinale URNW]
MIKKIENKNMGRSNLGWLQSIFHFSFAEYYNPKNMNFGSLRVVNDDLVKSNTGFPTHPHKDMEIVSYVVKGDLTHGDSMGNENTLTRGQVQYMSAGTGVYHSEYNLGDNTLRFLQIWILPDNTGYKPNYGDYRFTWEERKNKWLHMVSSKSGNAPIKINQDFNIYSIELASNEEINFPVNKGRQAYILQVEGSSSINEILLNERDAAEVIEENIYIKAKNTSHILVLEMKKDE